MTFARGDRAGTRTVWFAAIVVAIVGYAFDVRIASARLDEQLAENALRAAHVRAAEDELADRPRLEATRARLRAAARGSGIVDDTTHLVARYVRDAARIAARNRTTIAAITAADRITPATAAATLSSPPPVGPTDGLETIALDITVEGRYADVLATIRGLSRTRVPAAVDITALARKNADAPDATLAASLHVGLAHLTQTTRQAPSTPAAARDRTRSE